MKSLADAAVLWKRLKESRDLTARDGLVELYASLVRYVAGRMAMGMPAQVDVNDLESYGLFGLLDAIERFDPARGIKFETYATTRIRGAIIDGLRADTWAPALKLKVKQLEEAQVSLETQLGREPTDEEVASRLGMTTGELTRRRSEVASAIMLSLDETTSIDGEGGVSMAERIVDPQSPDPEAEAIFSDRKQILAEAIERLSEKERLVVALFYHEGLTAKEIAMVLSVSVARISQIHSKALLKLRGRLSRSRPHLL